MAWPFKSREQISELRNKISEDLEDKSREELESLVKELEPKVKRRDKFFEMSTYSTWGAVALTSLAGIIPETKEYAPMMYFGVCLPGGVITTGSMIYKWTGKRLLERITFTSSHAKLFVGLLRSIDEYSNQRNPPIH